MHRAKLKTLPENVQRSDLYEVFPPVGEPRPFPIFRTSSGTRGKEAYAIDDVYALEGCTHYWAAKGFDDVAPHPNDWFSQYEIVKRSNSAILNWPTKPNAEQDGTSNGG